MPERSARAGEFAGSTVAAIHIDYARNTLEELTAPVQRWRHQFADFATVLLAGGDRARALRGFNWCVRPVPDPDSGGLRRPATA